jgi:hypothetical protein
VRRQTNRQSANWQSAIGNCQLKLKRAASNKSAIGKLAIGHRQLPIETQACGVKQIDNWQSAIGNQ